VFHVFDSKGSGFVPKHDLRDVLMLDKGGFDFNDVNDIMTCFRSDAKENINMEGKFLEFFDIQIREFSFILNLLANSRKVNSRKIRY